jgi:nitrite reductase/ring-hydroxylating ferredoxin subunit
VAEPGEPEDGSIKPVRVDGKIVVLARSGARCGAIDSRCPHAGGPLDQGSVVDGFVVCPWHGREYDLVTGRCEGYEGVGAYRIEIRNDGIYLAVQE